MALATDTGGSENNQQDHHASTNQSTIKQGTTAVGLTLLEPPTADGCINKIKEVETESSKKNDSSPITNDDNDDDTLPPVSGPNRTYSISELFINPNLQRKSANIVLRKDPFCIPRVTDNVREYRPPFNPLNILVSEEKLLPRNFTFDFSEGIPGDVKSLNHDNDRVRRRRDSNTDEEATAPSFKKPRPAPTSENSSRFAHKITPLALPPKPFGDKLNTMGMLMGSLPRQQQPPSPILTPRASTLHNPFRGPSENKTTSLTTNGLPLSKSSSDLHQNGREHSGNEVAESAQQSHPSKACTPLGSMARMSLALDAEALEMNPVPKEEIGLPSISVSPYHYPRSFSSSSLSALTGITPQGSDQLMQFLPDRQVPVTWYTEKHNSTTHYIPNEFQPSISTYQPPLPPTYQQTLAPTYHPTLVPAYDAALVSTQPPALVPGYNEQMAMYPQEHSYMSSTPNATFAAMSVNPLNDALPSEVGTFDDKKKRPKNKLRPCSTPGCTRGARGKSGLCQKHGGGKRCEVVGCPKGAQGNSSLCLFHGGGHRCTVPGCTTGARGTSGMCAKHGGYKRARDRIFVSNVKVS